MSTAQIIITNAKNVNWEEMTLIDPAATEKRQYDANTDALLLEERKTGKQRSANLMSVSLFEDVIVEGEERFKILSMKIVPSGYEQYHNQ